MSFLLKPLFSRLFLFLYTLGIVSVYATLPNWKGACIYSNSWWELLLDVYFPCLLISFIPETVSLEDIRHKWPKVPQGKWTPRTLYPRTFVKALIYIVMYPLYIIDTFCFVKFGATINPSMLLLLGETNSNEAGEFLATYVNADTILSPVGWFLLIPLIHILLVIGCHYAPAKWRKLCQRKWETVKEQRVTCLIACSIANIILITLLAIAWPDSYANKQMYHKTMSGKTIGEVENSLASRPHTEMYQPAMRLAFSIHSNQLIAQQLDRLYAKVGNDIRIDSCDVSSSNIVLIIGESCNKRHSQLYGYDKKTTPNQVKLEKSGLLTKFDDAVTPWNLTSFTFKHLMTTYCVGDTAEWCDYPLFCEIFRRAGYRVSFFTNQFLPRAKDAVYDFSGGFFINDSTLSRAQFDIRNDQLYYFDEDLLHDYQRQVPPKTDKPTLSIFHLMGQHVNYRSRCPKSKIHWGADCYPNDTDLTDKQRKVMAEYDNATWYNDSVIMQIVNIFKNEDAIVVFLSDHGEEVFGPGARQFFGRKHNTEITKALADEEFRVPMWIYTTPKYRRSHPQVVEAIKAARKKPYMTDALSHLLMGLAGIHTPYYRPDHDILSPQYNAKRKRLLKHKVDYDLLK